MSQDTEKRIDELEEQNERLREDFAATTLMFQRKLKRECEAKSAEAVDKLIAGMKKELRFGSGYFDSLDDGFFEAAPENPILPAFGGESVNICYAANDNYALPCGVSISSVIENSSPETNYDILVLTADVSAKHRRDITQLADRRGNISIRFVNMKESAAEAHSDTLNYWSAETNFRFFLFEPLFSQYEKMLWLDCDLVADADVAELFRTDTEGFSAAATYDYSIAADRASKKRYDRDGGHYNRTALIRDYLVIKHPETYFNAGVMLYDLRRCREKTSLAELMKIVRSGEPELNDEEALNKALDGDIKLVDNGWNCMITYFQMRTESARYESAIYDAACAAAKSHRIVHYVSRHKPWLEAGVPEVGYFWKYARRTPWYEELLSGLFLIAAEKSAEALKNSNR